MIKLSKNVYCSTSAYYPGVKSIAVSRNAPVIVAAVEFLIEDLELPKKQMVYIRNIRSKKTNAQTFCKSGSIEIDPRRHSMYDFMSTLCHEMVHAKQIHTKQLTRGKNIHTVIWEGKEYLGPDHPKHADFDVYKELPWEVDANNQSIFLFQKLNNKLFKGSLAKQLLPVRGKTV